MAVSTSSGVGELEPLDFARMNLERAEGFRR
jgi:hypothetical protein